MRTTPRSTTDHDVLRRTRPCVVSTKVLPDERALIRALAAAEQTSVSEVLHRLLIPAVRKRLGQVAGLPVVTTDEGVRGE